MNKFGFSWKRLLGITAAKRKISKAIGIPLTRSGRQRKVGQMLGCMVFLGFLVVSLTIGRILV